MVICTPFDKPGHFYYNQKINCMRAAGTVRIGGQTYTFDPRRLLRRAGLGTGRVDVSQHMVLGQRLRAGGWRSLRLEHRLWLRGYLCRQREYAVLRWQDPQAGAGDLPHSHGGEAGGLSGPVALYLRRRAVRDGLCTHSGSGCLYGCEAHQIRPASGVRALHRHGPAGRRHACPGEGPSALPKRWRTSGKRQKGAPRPMAGALPIFAI